MLGYKDWHEEADEDTVEVIAEKLEKRNASYHTSEVHGENLHEVHMAWYIWTDICTWTDNAKKG